MGSTISTGKLNFDTASPILKATSKNAATEKRNLGHSPLQDKADNINLGANVAVGSGLAVATGGSSLGYQLAAGATGTIVAEKALPKVTAEQVTKKLYHKKETLK